MRFKKRALFTVVFMSFFSLVSPAFCFTLPDENTADCYIPVEGGWSVRNTEDKAAPRLKDDSVIGVVVPYPMPARRPLFPPADRSMIWSPNEMKAIADYCFRPLVMGYIKPRFVFDFHTAGGILGHLHLGIANNAGKGKWFHEFSDITTRYIDGRIDYRLTDNEFPGLIVNLSASPTSETIGLVVKAAFEGKKDDLEFIWVYGGASAYYTNWNDFAREYRYDAQDSAKDIIRYDAGTMALIRSFDKEDVYSSQIFCVNRKFEYSAHMELGSSFEARQGFGMPGTVTQSPRDVINAAQWVNGPQKMEKKNAVSVGAVKLSDRVNSGYILVGIGGNIKTGLSNIEQEYQNALKRNKSIAERIVVETPDPYLNSAVTSMAFSTEGLWGDTTILHGAWSWRMGYLGWRGWYGPLCYGWTDRVKKSIENHIAFSLIQDGPDEDGLRAIIEYGGDQVYYNMNEVFLDHVRAYYDYTDDKELMRKIFPVLEGIVEWESRRLQPENAHLYENALNTWISDSHWYIRGQCTQASAYMLNAYRLLSRLAEDLGENAVYYQKKAELIRAAMQRELWMPRKGVFAEYLDTRGRQMLHPEPELPTLYHSAEFGAADDLQIYQMIEWARTHLRREEMAGGGMAYWSSNWFPNHARSYTHSTYELAYAENLNFALTHYQVGESEDAYKILKSTYNGIFNDPTPGGLACHMTVKGQRRGNDEFADAISMWGRTVTEGLFGIRPHDPQGYLLLSPQLPEEWSNASIKTPYFSYTFNRDEQKIRIAWQSPVKRRVRLHYPVKNARVKKVVHNGADVNYDLSAGIDITWLNMDLPKTQNGTLEIVVESVPGVQLEPLEVTQGQDVEIRLSNRNSDRLIDPQSLLNNRMIKKDKIAAQVDGTPGPGVFFFNHSDVSNPRILPQRVKITPVSELAERVWEPLGDRYRDLLFWEMIDLTSLYNNKIADVPEKITKTAVPPALPATHVGFDYWKDHISQTRNSGTPWAFVSDAAWRQKIKDDFAWTADGIPFKSPKEGHNIAAVAMQGDFPESLRFDVNAKGKTLFLMVSGTTFPSQSHVPQIQVTIHYEDLSSEAYNLVSPIDIGDCWGTWCGRYHDTAANGFENLGGRNGPAGSIEVEDMHKPVEVDTEAHLIKFNLKPGMAVHYVELRAMANDVVFGIMGASILK